jgi:uncharacterized membrane protein
MKPCYGLLMLAFLACNDASAPDATPATDSTQISDSSQSITTTYADTESDIPANFTPGYYTGTAPCTDCKAIHRKILLLPDHRFHLMEEYEGKEAPPVQVDGQWKTDNNKLKLLVNGNVSKTFAVTTRGLSELNSSGTPVTNRPDAYLIHKTIGADNKAWMEKKAAGIDFFALGNEPFWLLEIEKDKQISFLLVDNEKPTVLPYAVATQQTGQWIYNVQTEIDKLQMVITRQFCSDGMSDNWYEFKVEVNYNGTVYMGCGVQLNDLPE